MSTDTQALLASISDPIRLRELEIKLRNTLRPPEGKNRFKSNLHLLQARENLMTIRGLAKRAGISAAYLSKLLSSGNKANPSLLILLSIAEALNIDVVTLITRDLLSEFEQLLAKKQ